MTPFSLPQADPLRRLIRFSLAILAVCGLSTLSSEASLIVDPGEPPGDDRAFGGTAGFEFTVDSAGLIVTELGAWDDGVDGFIDDVTVGLWDTAATPNLLASVTLSAGTSGTLNDQTRFLALAPGDEVALVQGNSYVLAANFGSDNFKDDAPSGSAATYLSSDFTFDQARFDIGSGLNFPGSTTGDDEFFGANMVTVIPEPSTGIALGLLFVFAAFCRRRRRRE